MYERRYGLIRTLAPLHVGASAGEEAGNLNLIFRDAYTQTGIIPGSSIRGRFRAEMRRLDTSSNRRNTDYWYGNSSQEDREGGDAAEVESADNEFTEGEEISRFSESRVKFEYASLLWIPVFCPGQPVVWVSCPRLLRRHARVAGLAKEDYAAIHQLANIGSTALSGSALHPVAPTQVKLFFNLGYLTLQLANSDNQTLLEKFVPPALLSEVDSHQLAVVDDASIGAIHDMALYRQSRVKLRDDEKRVQFFFNVEALPEGSVLSCPIAIRTEASDSGHGTWLPFPDPQATEGELYFGGLESIGFGRCQVTILEVAP